MDARIKELEDKITELKKRFPAHSLKPEMVEQLEELEDQLERALQEKQQDMPG